jgi:hypothetical protein
VRPRAAGGALQLPVVATHPVQFLDAGRLRGARGPGVHRRGRDPGQPAPCQALRPRAVLQDAGPDGRALCRPAQRAGQHGGDRAALQPEAWCWASRSCRTFRRRWWTASACRWTTTSATPATRAWSGAWLALYPDPAARRRTAALCGAAGVRAQHHHQDGLPGLLPDRLGLHRLGQGQRLPGGAGPGLGCGQPGGLCAVHHRPGPAALQAAVRALPEPRARVDARLRHRLLPGQPRPRHRVRQGQVRARRGQPDRHLRHHGQQGRAARRGPGAGHGLRPCRQRGQAGARRAGQDLHPGPGARRPRPAA